MSLFYTSDPVADFERHDREQAKRLAERPRCDICDQPIQDEHYYLINGDNVCPECLNNEFRKDIDF